MARILILCPTHDHVDTLYFAIASAQAQTLDDWEMTVICDGAPDRTLQILEAISAADRRITFEAHPKSYKTGEIHRDRVVRASNAEFVCHLGDDDVWAPDHLEQMTALMAKGDWVNQSAMSILNDGSVEWAPRNMGGDVARLSMGKGKFAVAVGFSHTAYRMDSYLTLPEGWTQTPKDFGASDQFMAAKFLTRPFMRVASTAACSSLKFTSRSGESLKLPPEGFAARIAPWLARIAKPGFMRTAARSADMTAPLLELLSRFAPDAGKSFEAAYRFCGLSIADEADACDVAVDGAPMALPLTPAQRVQAEDAYLSFLRWHHGSFSIDHWIARIGTEEKDWVRGLKGLSRTRPQISIDALTELESRFGAKPLTTSTRLHLRVQMAELDAALDDIARARQTWPAAKWLDAIEAKVARALEERAAG